MNFIRISLLFLFLVGGSSASWAQQPSISKLQWKNMPPLPPVRGEHVQLGFAGMAGGVSNGALIVAGGANFPGASPWNGGVKKYYDHIFVLTTGSSTEQQWHDSTFRLPMAMGYGASVTTPNGILIIGGENETGKLDQTWLLQWDVSRKQVVVAEMPKLPVALTNASATIIGTRVFLTGGETDKGTGSFFFSLDLDNPTGWESLPSLPVAVSHAVTVAQYNGDATCIYVIGGRAKNTEGKTEFSERVFEYHPELKRWKEYPGLTNHSGPLKLSAASAVAVGATNILVFGGDEGQTFNAIESYNRSIATAAIESEKELLTKWRDSIITNHPGFSRSIRLYSTITRVWTNIGEMPSAPVTTLAIKWGNEIFIPSGEVKPGVRTPAVLRAEVDKPVFFSWADIIVLIICFFLMTFARYFLTKKQSNTEDYFKGGKRIPRWAAGISIYGAKLSAITFMGIPAKTFSSNWSYFFMLMTIVMIMPVIIKFFIPFYRRLNVTSAYEYLEKRFSSSSRILVSLMYMLFQLGRMSIVIILPSIALTLVTGINIYLCIFLIGAISIFFTVKGGIEAVIWVEVVQVLILASGALFCLFYIPFQINDYSAAWESIQANEKLKTFDFQFDFTQPTFWVVIIGGLSMHLFTYGADQTTVQRYLTTKNEKESVRSLRLGALLSVPSTLVFFSIGTLMFLFFREHPDQVNIGLNSTDNIFPWFIVSQLPAGISGLLIAGIFAAAMSSTEASMNSVATLVTTDFYKKWRPDSSEKKQLFFARMVTLIIGVVVTLIALGMAYRGISSLWDQFNTILGLFTGSIGGVFLLGIFTKRANGPGALAGILISCVTQLWVSENSGLHLLMYSFTGLVSCFVFGYVCSLLFPKKTKNITGLTIYDMAAYKKTIGQ